MSATVHDVIRSQYGAALQMLANTIAACPEALWADDGSPNPFWRVAYHALFYAHLYLQPTEADFTPWSEHTAEAQALGPEAPALTPYTQSEVLAYLEFCRAQVATQIPQLNLTAESGFYWLPFNKLELQLYNIRHVQQHAGELSGRLLNEAKVEIPWTGKSDL